MAESVVRIEIPIEAKDETSAGVNSAKRNLDQLANSATKAGKAVQDSETKVSKYDDTVKKTQNTFQSWVSKKYHLAIEAVDRVSPALKTIKSGLSGITSKAHRIAVTVLDKATAPLRGILNIIKNPILQGASILGITVGLKDTIDTYKDFESTMSNVKAISGASSAEFEQLTAKAEEMGAKTKFTAKEAGDAFTYMAMAGWKTKDMLNGIEGIMNLAAASGEDLGTVSDIVTDALTAFGMSADESGHFADVLAAASSNSNTNVAMMGETFKYAASMAGSLGYNVEDVALAIGLMANSGIKSSMAGTALNTIFTRLATDAGASSKKLGALGTLTKKLGVQFYDASGDALPLGQVLDGIRESMKGLSDEEKSNYAKTIAGTQAQKGLLAIVNASESDYKKLKEAIENADGAAQEMADTNLDNLQGSLTLLQSALDGVKIAAGERMAPYIRQFADWLTTKMPEIQNSIGEFFDWFDTKDTAFKQKLQDITGSSEFQNADIFGKVKILWDEIIVEPFSEWWNSTGKVKMAEKAKEVGSFIGKSINSGIMMLLGIDVSGALEDGTNIGKQFAAGFSDGFNFDEIQPKLMQGIKNIFTSAGKLLPGGEGADLGSLISAYLIAKVAPGAISLGKDIFNVGKGSFQLGRTMVGSAGTLTDMTETGTIAATGGKGLLSLATKIGATGGATSAAGATALGLGAIAGGAIGAGTAISGGVDIYKAVKSTDADESKMYGWKGGLKLGGVGAGAAAGAAIGSIIPGLGTAVGALVGAGIGGISGIVASKKVEKDYEKQKAEAEAQAKKIQEESEKMVMATGRSLSGSKLESKELKEALDNANVSAEQFTAMFNETVQGRIQKAFGNVKMSLKEIKSLADEIVFRNQTEQVDNFQKAVSSADSALSTYTSDLQTLNRQNWNSTMKIETSNDHWSMDESDITNYKQNVDNFISDAQSYLNDKHYEGTNAMQLLFGKDVDLSGDNGLDKTFEDLKLQLDEKVKQLSDKQTAYLSNNYLSIPEQENIENLESQISDILKKVSDAESQSSMQALQIKYGGADIDYESFQSLQTQLAEKTQELTDNYDHALQIDLTNLNLRFNGDTSSEEYQTELQKIKDAYQEQINSLTDNTLTFQLQTVVESGLGDDLKKAYGSSSSTEDLVSELQDHLSTAFANNSDATKWTSEDISKWFNLEGLSAEAQAALDPIIQSIAESIPSKMAEYMGDQETYKQLNAQLGPVSDTTLNNAKDAQEATQAMTAAGVVQGNAYIDSTTSTITDRADEVRTAADTALQTEFADPLNATLKLTLTPDITFNGNLQSMAQQAAQSSLNGTATISAPGHKAYGGISSGEQLTWINEEGPEAIIPLVPQRRSRALDLFSQVADILGVGYNAEGTINGLPTAYQPVDINSYTGSNRSVPIGYNMQTEASESEPIPVDTNSGKSDSTSEVQNNTPIEVSVQMSPTFQIEGGGQRSEEDLVAIIKRHMREISDEMGGEIAIRLEKVYENMPYVSSFSVNH